MPDLGLACECRSRAGDMANTRSSLRYGSVLLATALLVPTASRTLRDRATSGGETRRSQPDSDVTIADRIAERLRKRLARLASSNSPNSATTIRPSAFCDPTDEGKHSPVSTSAHVTFPHLADGVVRAYRSTRWARGRRSIVRARSRASCSARPAPSVSSPDSIRMMNSSGGCPGPTQVMFP